MQDFIEIQQNSYSEKKVDFKLDDLIQRSIGDVEMTAKSKDIKLEIYRDPFIPDVLCADFRIIQGLLFNLLSNSVKYTDQGWIKLSVKTTEDFESLQNSPAPAGSDFLLQS